MTEDKKDLEMFIKSEKEEQQSVINVKNVELSINLENNLKLRAIDEEFENELNQKFAVKLEKIDPEIDEETKNLKLKSEYEESLIKKEKEENFELQLSDETETFIKPNCKIKHDSEIETKPICKLEVNEKPKTNFQCKICFKFFSSSKTLYQHRKIHNRDDFKCQKCNKVFKQRGFYDRHNCNTTCMFCNVEFDSRQQLNAHKRTQHTKELNIVWMRCDHCGLKFSKKFRLILHMKTKHVNQKVEAFICDYDGKIFYHKDRLYRHMSTHTQLIECLICHKKIKPRTIWSHMKKTHETEYRFQCETCQKYFKSNDLLRHHMSTHEKKFVCKICNHRFSIKYGLKQHMKVHINPNAFVCQTCGKTFNHQNNLNSHLKTHNKDRLKPHQCSRCDYSSYKKDHLRYHMKSHERLDKKFENIKNAIKCPKCPTMCKSKTLLGMHMKYVHPAIQFQCDLCGRFIKMKSNVKKHLTKFHKINL